MEKQLETDLLHVAHESIAEELGGGLSETYAVLREKYKEIYIEPVGLFVTLKKKDTNNTSSTLRGCIGTIEGVYPLIEGVYRLAKESAFEDPRFLPVSIDECSLLTIHISILSTLQEITQPSAIILGIHGVVYQYRHHRALFLPEVALEQHWSLHKLLTQLCIKASLPPNHYHTKEGKLYTFTVESFEDNDE